MQKRKGGYDRSLPRRMYTYFISYSDSGAPSYDKFAKSIGITLEELTGYRKHKKFDEAYRECGEIRRDYLIDNALTKRFDTSLVKFLLSSEFGMGDKAEDDSDRHLSVTIEVVD